MGKRLRSDRAKVDPEALYPLDEAITLAKETASAKFDEAIDLCVQLGIDSRKSEQAVRGAVSLPAGLGKTVRVAALAQDKSAEEAEKAGADRVGYDDLAEDIKAGKIDFDVLVATPEAMRLAGQLGKILGPRGLMPNPKIGTVSQDLGEAVRIAKAGQVQYRADKSGIIHVPVGKASFEAAALKNNISAVIDALKKAKPSSSKGIYLRKAAISATMGVGVQVDIAELR